MDVRTMNCERWAEDPQPEPKEDLKAAPSQRFRVQAKVWRCATGKAAKSQIKEFRWFSAPTAEEALAWRTQFIQDYLQPSKRQRTSSLPAKSLAAAETAAESAADSVEVAASMPRPQRAARPTNLAEPRKAGPLCPRAGPGRGHTYEPARPLHQQLEVLLPPPDAEESGNWFKQMQLKQKWRSERMAQLERQVEELLVANLQQADTIAALRQRVRCTV